MVSIICCSKLKEVINILNHYPLFLPRHNKVFYLQHIKFPSGTNNNHSERDPQSSLLFPVKGLCLLFKRKDSPWPSEPTLLLKGLAYGNVPWKQAAAAGTNTCDYPQGVGPSSRTGLSLGELVTVQAMNTARRSLPACIGIGPLLTVSHQQWTYCFLRLNNPEA